MAPLNPAPSSPATTSLATGTSACVDIRTTPSPYPLLKTRRRTGPVIDTPSKLVSMTHTVEADDSVLTKHYTSWSRDEPGREWAALTLLSRQVPDLVPAPLARGTDSQPWVSMSVLPGLPLGGSLTPEQLDGLGEALGALWSTDPDGLPSVGVPAVIDRTSRSLAVLREGDGVIADAATAAADWLGTAVEVLTAVQDPVVGHGDPNLANYLWDGTRIRIVDFEDAGLGDLTLELANLVEHLSGRETDWSTLLSRFPVDPERFRAARSLWAAFSLTLIGPGGPSAARNPPGTAEAQAERVMSLVRPTA
ncbi:aminoglycoside phosphotransferase family protein [Kribbella capetownensis]|uniref:Aminoglycoside phosphotransferase family protein n=2 Tax=Kribbella capetownensis TaxID=1572659 RepID=A0A4R0JYS7_9ACTN|nr:aminoglycoside phosphotransferase family protein [Kribbella capetownensis]